MVGLGQHALSLQRRSAGMPKPQRDSGQGPRNALFEDGQAPLAHHVPKSPVLVVEHDRRGLEVRRL
jgi:hypothetical protein